MDKVRLCAERRLPCMLGNYSFEGAKQRQKCIESSEISQNEPGPQRVNGGI